MGYDEIGRNGMKQDRTKKVERDELGWEGMRRDGTRKDEKEHDGTWQIEWEGTRRNRHDEKERNRTRLMPTIFIIYYVDIFETILNYKTWYRQS